MQRKELMSSKTRKARTLINGRQPVENAAPSTALDRFQPAVRDWFTQSFAAPTKAQDMGWPAIARGDWTLIFAPTGSGKTLAAFLCCLNRLVYGRGAEPCRTCGERILYRKQGPDARGTYLPDLSDVELKASAGIGRTGANGGTP